MESSVVALSMAAWAVMPVVMARQPNRSSSSVCGCASMALRHSTAFTVTVDVPLGWSRNGPSGPIVMP